jgi:uncharacterized protein DUF6084
MPDLTFSISGADTVAFAAAPMIVFQLQVSNSASEEKIHSIALRSQVMIEVTRRPYSSEEQAKLRDLFGEPDRWSRTLRTTLWTHVTSVVPAFQAQTTVDLHLPCTFDFNVAATKYFYGLEDGEIPLLFQFSGSVFYENAEGGLNVAPISWDKETKFRLLVKTWRQTIDTHYPNSAWLCLRRDVFDRLYQYKVSRGIPSWEQALESILASTEEMARS